MDKRFFRITMLAENPWISAPNMVIKVVVQYTEDGGWVVCEDNLVTHKWGDTIAPGILPMKATDEILIERCPKCEEGCTGFPWMWVTMADLFDADCYIVCEHCDTALFPFNTPEEKRIVKCQ